MEVIKKQQRRFFKRQFLLLEQNRKCEPYPIHDGILYKEYKVLKERINVIMIPSWLEDKSIELCHSSTYCGHLGLERTKECHYVKM